ncbi:MAG: aldehyde dehydrogenase family protein [Ignavibacteriales bacterium]|nr:aldehyde dehydrogenase family protein [Ignavibacteriales bacterium]
MKVKAFKNEPINDFSIKSNIDKQKKALQEVRTKLGKTYNLFIGGKEYQTENKFNSYNPSNKDEVIASFSKGTVDLVNLAVETAYNKFQDWQYVSAEKKAKNII